MSTAGPSGAIRAFVALELPDALRAEIRRLVERLRPDVRGIRWVAPESMHLTLRFLGWSSPARLEAVREAVSRAAAATPALDAEVGGLGTFPERGRARVLWIGLGLAEPAFRLQQACERAAVAAGFAPEERAFSPHLTLGRWKEPARPPGLPEAGFGRVVLDRLVLYQSVLRATGAIYTPLESWTLGAG